MKGSKENLSTYLTSQFEKRIQDKKYLRNAADYIINNSGLPPIEVMDTMNLRTNMEYSSDRMLYWFLKAIDDKRIGDYFSNREIIEYETPVEKETFKFPIRWKMVEITEGMQWIGRITVKELMKLRDVQLINYNERTQRTLKHIAGKDFEYYQIFLNKHAVEEITKSFETGQYIPNTITLNIPLEAQFYYKDGYLVIKNTNKLDIIDGYHRYVAMSNLYNQNKDFNYVMELRVVCFTEAVAKQFIWQEDQKTKMKKMDLESLNQSNPANQVINLINQEGIYRNVIGRNGAIIDQGLAANLIERLYFNYYRVVKRKDILDTKENIVYRFGIMLHDDPDIFDKPWGYEFTIIAFDLIANPEVPDPHLLRDIKGLTEIICNNSELRLELGKKGNPVTTRILTRLNKIYDQYIERGL